jgi:hypothetical protein
MTNAMLTTWHSFQLREISGMSGASNYGSLIDEWLLPPTPSPRTLMSSFLNEEFSSAPFSGPHDQSEKSREVLNSSDEVPSHAVKGPFQNGFPNLFSAKSNSNGGLAERRAARAGFSVPKIDTSRVGSSTVIRSPVSIPPGLSPTTLLESPVFLYNKMVCDISLIGFFCSQYLSVTLLSNFEITHNWRKHRRLSYCKVWYSIEGIDCCLLYRTWFSAVYLCMTTTPIVVYCAKYCILEI